MITPFLIIYLSLFKEIGVRSWTFEVSKMLPRWYDIFNVSTANYIWGNMINTIFPNINSRDFYCELSIGFPLISLVLFIISFVYFYNIIKNKSSKKQINFDFNNLICFISGLIVITCFILMLKVNKSLSLWWFIFKFFPSGGAIRAVYRFNLVIGLGLSISVALFITNLSKEINYRFLKFLILTLIVFIVFFENQNSFDTAEWSKNETYNYLNSVPIPPKDCKVFFIDYSNEIIIPSINELQLDAWLIANKFNIVTINGYSGNTPKYWKLENAGKEEYIKNVNEWLIKYSIINIYRFDSKTKLWIKHNYLKSNFWNFASKKYNGIIVVDNQNNKKFNNFNKSFINNNCFINNNLYTDHKKKSSSIIIKDIIKNVLNNDYLYIIKDYMLFNYLQSYYLNAKFLFIDGLYIIAPNMNNDDIKLFYAVFEFNNHVNIKLDDFLLNLDNDKLVLISISDEGTNTIDNNIAETLKQLGIKSDLRGKYRYSYIAIYEKGLNNKSYEVLSEKQINIDLKKNTKFDNFILPFDLHIESTGGLNNATNASIKINDIEYITKDRGLNFVTYSLSKKKIVDVKTFDTLLTTELWNDNIIKERYDL